MTVSKEEFQSAKDRMDALRGLGHAVSASYDGTRRRVHVELSSGIQVAVPADLLEELTGASSGQLDVIEVTPSGLGLHWPQLDADVYVPAMLQGIFGSRSWMAAQLGAAGGKATTPAKATAARENGRKGGRPPNNGETKKGGHSDWAFRSTDTVKVHNAAPPPMNEASRKSGVRKTKRK